jgi:hypothetical protein
MEEVMQQHTHSATRVIAVVAATALLGAAACSSDSNSIAPGSSSAIAFTTAASGASASMVPVTNGGHTLDLTAVTLTISRVELKRAQTDACPGDNEGDDGHPSSTPSTEQCGELKVGPFTVDLPLTGGMVTIPANTVPAGTFREFELRISRVELKGTFDGKAFDDTLSVGVKSEAPFATPLVVSADTPTSITVNVPVANWLVNSDGSLVDPTKLSTNPSLMEQIRSRIQTSFRAFEDRDHDGHDDHGDHSGRD